MSLPFVGQSLLANEILSIYLKWRLRYIFVAIKNGLGRGQIFFQNQECVNILGCSVTFYEYKKCIFDACRQRLHNSGLICNQATLILEAGKVGHRLHLVSEKNS